MIDDGYSTKVKDYQLQSDMQFKPFDKPKTENWCEWVEAVWNASPLLGEYEMPKSVKAEILRQAKNSLAAKLRNHHILLSDLDMKTVVMAAVTTFRENENNNKEETEVEEKTFW